MILFLDFDGVLHPETKLTTRTEFEHRPLLWQILRSVPDVEVVFSTSWRTSHSLDELILLATKGGGEDLAHRFVGKNPVINKETREQGDYAHRRDECIQWIEENRARFHYWIRDIPWIAVDDIAYWYGLPCFNLHMTDYRTGLTATDVAAIINKLKRMR